MNKKKTNLRLVTTSLREELEAAVHDTDNEPPIEIDLGLLHNEDMTVTKDLLDSRLETIETRMDGRINALESKIDAGITKVLNEMQKQNAELQSEMHKQNAGLQKDFNSHLKYYLTTTIGVGAVIIGVMTFIINNLKLNEAPKAQQSPPIIINVPAPTIYSPPVIEKKANKK